MMFKDKVVAITGAAGGIGQSLCHYFAGEGAQIAAIDKNAGVVSFARELQAPKSLGIVQIFRKLLYNWSTRCVVPEETE